VDGPSPAVKCAAGLTCVQQNTFFWEVSGVANNVVCMRLSLRMEFETEMKSYWSRGNIMEIECIGYMHGRQQCDQPRAQVCKLESLHCSRHGLLQDSRHVFHLRIGATG
jgi:hypothetical protein